MNLGVDLLGHPPADIVTLATVAEELGFRRIWLGDHVGQPDVQESSYPYATRTLMFPDPDFVDPLVQAGCVLTATSRLEVATGVHLLPLHHPLVVARSLATLADVAPGRLLFGVGVGWLAEEYAAVGIDFRTRGARMDEALAVLDRAIGGGSLHFDGHHFAFENVTTTVRNWSVPVVVGGTGAAAVRRAALHGAGWYSPPNVTVEEARRIRDRIEDRRQELGNDGEFRYFIRLPALAPALLEEFAEAGFADFTLGGNDIFPREQLQTMALQEKRERLADAFHLFVPKN